MTAPDTSAEVERIRALWARVDLADRPSYDADEASDPGDGWAPGTGVTSLYVGGAEALVLRWHTPDGRALALDLPEQIAALLAALDRVTAERDTLAARLPSPESVTRARLVAAEIVEVLIGLARDDGALPDRLVANAVAAHIRDRADTHAGTCDEGGDVDERELLACAQRVDRCTTLGELEAIVREWREVSGG